MAVTATNGEDVPVAVTLGAAFGSKSFAAVAPGKAAYQSFNVRAATVAAETVTVTGTATVDGRQVVAEQQVPFAGLDCG